MKLITRALCTTLIFSLAACGGMGGILGDGAMNSSTIASGLKQALEIGTNNAVKTTSAAGGFSANAERFIGLPGVLDDVGKVMKSIGMGQAITQLESSMNLAAEHASEKAAPVFVDAITQMSFADAMGILKGNDTAATDYFREKTGPGLRQLYGPIVRAEMDKVGVVQQFNGLMDSYNAIPFKSKPQFSIENYVTDKALDGLFSVLASEEKLIRTDPTARVTALLQKVFALQ